jgi:hypothetical protein
LHHLLQLHQAARLWEQRAKVSARSELEKKVAKKRGELDDLRAKARDAEVYIEALEEALKVLPRDGVNSGDAEAVLRPGGNAALARAAILERGAALHVDELLEAMGKEADRQNRLSVSGALAAYVRKGEIFTRPAPNTFGLIELNASNDDDDDMAIKDDDVPF